MRRSAGLPGGCTKRLGAAGTQGTICGRRLVLVPHREGRVGVLSARLPAPARVSAAHTALALCCRRTRRAARRARPRSPRQSPRAAPAGQVRCSFPGPRGLSIVCVESSLTSETAHASEVREVVALFRILPFHCISSPYSLHQNTTPIPPGVGTRQHDPSTQARSSRTRVGPEVLRESAAWAAVDLPAQLTTALVALKAVGAPAQAPAASPCTLSRAAVAAAAAAWVGGRASVRRRHVVQRVRGDVAEDEGGGRRARACTCRGHSAALTQRGPANAGRPPTSVLSRVRATTRRRSRPSHRRPCRRRPSRRPRSPASGARRRQSRRPTARRSPQTQRCRRGRALLRS